MKQKKATSISKAIRKRPGMYFGDMEHEGGNNAINELIANAVDQFLAGEATTVGLKINGKRIAVFDDGPGLPFDQKAPDNEELSLVEHYLLCLHDTPTADNHGPHIHISGGLGLAVLNAASQEMVIESSNGNKLCRQVFGKGRKVSEAYSINGYFPKGTKIEIVLDPEIFGDNSLNMLELRKMMFELAHFYPGLTVELENERFFSRNGLLGLASLIYKRPSTKTKPAKTFFFEGKKNNTQIQVAALGDSSSETEFMSWVNGIESVNGGTHVEALIRSFAKVNWLPNIVLIHVIMHNPKFAGPTKDVLMSNNIIDTIEELVEAPIQERIQDWNIRP